MLTHLKLSQFYINTNSNASGQGYSECFPCQFTTCYLAMNPGKGKFIDLTKADPTVSISYSSKTWQSIICKCQNKPCH